MSQHELEARPPLYKRHLRKLIALLLIGALVAAYFLLRGDGKAPLNYETKSVRRGTVVAKVTATGTLSALVTVSVGSQVSGRLQEIRVDYNSQVKKGEILAKIDPQMFEAANEQARANLKAAESNLVKAQVQAKEADRQFARAKSLAEKNMIAQADVDSAEAAAEVARAQILAVEGALAQAKAALNQARINVDYTTITSPINGVVISRSVDVGQTVAASFQAPTLFTIAEDLTHMQVDTSVSEADVGKLRAGMPASFTVDAYPGETFTGTVRQIRNAAQTVQNVVTYDAVIDVANPELKLRPGMTASVTFVYAESKDVLRVPNAALRFKPAGETLAQMLGKPADGKGEETAEEEKSAKEDSAARNERAVWILGAEQKPRKVAVVTGLSDGSWTEIVSGEVKEGDTVITDIAKQSAGGSGQKRISFGGPPPR